MWIQKLISSFADIRIFDPDPGTMERNSVFDRKFSDSLLR